MNLRLVIPVVAAFALAAALPASACDGHKKSSATTASADHSCSGMSRSTAWAGAWLQRSAAGELTVAAVAKGSAAARSGLRQGDVVLAVNGRDLNAESGHCSDGSVCAIGSSFAYTVQRGRATRVVKVKLEKMPAEAAMRFANLEPTYEPTLAAIVIPVAD